MSSGHRTSLSYITWRQETMQVSKTHIKSDTLGNRERSAIQFITRISEYSGDAGNIIPYGLQLLQEMTGAYLSLQIVPQDNNTARIRNAIPFFLDDMALNAASIQQFIEQHDHAVVYWRAIPEQQHVFSEVLQALSSAMIMPLQQGNITVVVILGWSGQQNFDESFRLFAELVKAQLDNTLRQSAALQSLQADHMLHTALLETLPHAIVYVGNDGKDGWINSAAAAMLQLPRPGRQDAAILSRAMESLSYNVSVLPVESATAKGRLWIFE